MMMTMTEGAYKPVKRKPLPPGAEQQPPAHPGDSLLGNNGKLRESTVSAAIEHDSLNHAVASKTTLSVHSLRFATVAFTLLSIGLAAWIMYYIHVRVENWTHSSVIGGNFSQAQAKIIDFLTSAIGAPLILALFNYVSFQIARACVVDTEGASCTLSLKALVEVGTTTFGSYDPFKLTALFATSRVRVIVLATTALLSAVSFSTLSNVIAYEAFQTDANQQISIPLDYLYRPPGQSSLQASQNLGHAANQMPLMSSTELLSEFTSQYFEVMTTVSFTVADSLLEQGKYIGINVTNASVSAVPASVDHIFDVPAYQLSYDCVPALAHNISFVTSPTITNLLEISLNLDIPGSPPNISFEALIWNGESSVVSGFMSPSAFVAFESADAPYASKTVYLGIFSEALLVYTNITSKFGQLQNTLFNNTAAGGSVYTNMYGVACQVHYNVGTVNLSRQTNSSTWSRSLGKFAEEHSILSLLMKDLQLFPNFVGPVSNSATEVMPGIGGALASSTNITSVAEVLNPNNSFEDFGSFAVNYLYVEGEARRIAYEVAESAPGQQGMSYNVQAAATVLRYRITFVPWILLVGLLSMALAGICVIILIFLARKSTASRSGRIISPIRLIADVAAGLPSDDFEQVSPLTNNELQKWSQSFKVKYYTSMENGRIKMRSLGSGAWISQDED